MSGETQPVAWRVKDYADGWTVHQYEHEAHRAARNGNLIEPLYTRAPINRPSPEAGESGKQPFERYPALASWIERLANANMDLPLGDWMVFVGALNMTLARLEAELAEARKERDGLRWAIMGGEDAPGLLDTLSHEYVLNALAENRSALRWYATQAEAQRDAALEALKPFSEAADCLDDDLRDEWNVWEMPAALSVTVGDLRRAAQALASLSPAKDEETQQ